MFVDWMIGLNNINNWSFEGDTCSLLHYIQWIEAYGGQKILCNLSPSTPSMKITSKGVITYNYIHVFDKCAILNCKICR